MSLVEQRQNVIVDGFDGGRDKRAAGVAQLRQTRRHAASRCSTLIVTSYETPGNSARKPRDDRRRVADAVEEVRIAERDVPGAGGDLRRERQP